MPLKASDIAILVRTNEEARRMQQDLAVLRIPAVLYSTEDVFDSHEAMEMERILTGIILSHREGLVRAALATDIMGRGGDDLAALLADEKLWEKAIVTFRGYFELWHEQGFMRMFRHLMLQEKVRSRLLSCPDGERRVTNVLHLSEILHQEAWERKLGLNELLKWLAEQRNPQLRRGQETQLRLESDENAVKVVTIHKSKGLEYPVVFCPFAWGSSRRKDDKSPFTFHDANHDWALTLDLGSPEREGNRVLAEKETLAENVRLLYVALTRAKKRCYLAWGPFNTAETSAPAYLFHHRGGAESLNPVAETAAAFKELDDSSMLERLREIERLSAGSVELAHLPLGPGKKVTGAMSEAGVLSCRKFHAAIDTSWRVSSFSSLVSDAAQTAELPDRDESDRPTSADVEAIDPALPGRKADIFSFPRGAKAGTLLHDILEHLDFTESDPRVMENLVAEKLNEYGFDPAWQGAVCAMLDRVLAVPLGINGEAFSLSSIAGGDRLNELEFYCALKPITPASLQKLFSRYLKNAPDLPRLLENFSPSLELENVKPLLKPENVSPLSPKGGEGGFSSPAAAALVRQPSSNQSIGNLFPWVAEKFPEHLGRLNFHPTRGFMRGFVDLVFRYGGRFYLVDWKSNHLGNSIEDYHQEALVQAMLRDYYLLQYHLYTVALDRYLALRLPDYHYDRDFGGIFYIFLRGVDPVAGARYGVYRDRPPQELIAALVAGLIA